MAKARRKRESAPEAAGAQRQAVEPASAGGAAPRISRQAENLTPAQVKHLQRAAGNRAVAQLVQGMRGDRGEGVQRDMASEAIAAAGPGAVVLSSEALTSATSTSEAMAQAVPVSSEAGAGA